MADLYVHLHLPPDEPTLLASFRAALPANVHLTLGPESQPDARCQILIMGGPTEANFAACPHLRAVIVPWAGVPEKTLALLSRYPHIALHNLHHNAAPTAENALALLLAAAKFIVPFDRALRSGDWTPRYVPTPALILEGKTALVLGYGEIGRRVGRYCHALGMRVLALRRSGLPADDFAEVHTLESLPHLLPQADALIITLPLTAVTRGLLDEAALNPCPRAVCWSTWGAAQLWMKARCTMPCDTARWLPPAWMCGTAIPKIRHSARIPCPRISPFTNWTMSCSAHTAAAPCAKAKRCVSRR